jgi:hypothetical protein
VDVVLLAIATGVAIQLVRKQRRLIISADGVLGVISVVTLGAMLAYGLASGGSPKPALWQARPFVHLVLFALLGTQLLETPRHVGRLIAAFVAATSCKALQIVWIFFAEAGGRFGAWRSILGHEDSVFLAAVIVLAIALVLYRVPGFWRAVLLIVAPFALAALALNLRRAAYVALGLSVLLMPLLLHGRRRAALGAVACGFLAFVLYGAVAVAHPEAPFAMPFNKVRTIVAPAPGSQDSSSNLYRTAENYNLRRTIAAHPFGLGFGHPFELHVPIADISFLLPLWRYHPHNMILGIWTALGSVGFVLFLSYLGAAVMLASHNLRWHVDPQAKAFDYFLLTSLVSGLIVSVLDQFLWVDRGALFLGAVVAMVAALHRPLARATHPADHSE